MGGAFDPIFRLGRPGILLSRAPRRPDRSPLYCRSLPLPHLFRATLPGKSLESGVWSSGSWLRSGAPLQSPSILRDGKLGAPSLDQPPTAPPPTALFPPKDRTALSSREGGKVCNRPADLKPAALAGNRPTVDRFPAVQEMLASPLLR